MATSAVLEDAITCCICFDIYRDPQALQCLHTLCKPCIDQLAVRGRVECPECRETADVKTIRQDFKTQTLIDDHKKKKKKEHTNKHSSSNCGFCSDQNKDLVSHCKECDIFLCAGCENGHKRLKVCANHTVKSLNDIINIAQSKLKDGVKQLKKQKLLITRKSDEIDDSIKRKLDQQDKHIDTTDKHFEKLISDLLKKRLALLKKIREHTCFEMKDLRKSKEVNDKLKAEIQAKIQMLQQVIDTEDVITLYEMASDMDGCLYNKMSGITARINDSVTEGLVHVEVIEAEKGFSVNYDHLRNKHYNLSLRRDTEVKIYRICMIKNKLWCAAYSDGIQVYDLDLNLLQQIRSDKYNYVVGLTEWQKKDVIVACSDKNGLHQLTQPGEYIQNIANGEFTDVSSNGRSIIALEKTTKKLIIFVCKNKVWVETHHFPVPNGGAFSDRCVVVDQAIVVSMFFKHCIVKYTTKGRNQQEIGQEGRHKAGELYYPIICGVDTSRNMLVADCYNHRFQVYCPSEQQWYVISLPWPQAKPHPVDAVIDGDGKHIWVVSKTEPRIMKFSTS